MKIGKVLPRPPLGVDDQLSPTRPGAGRAPRSWCPATLHDAPAVLRRVLRIVRLKTDHKQGFALRYELRLRSYFCLNGGVPIFELLIIGFMVLLFIFFWNRISMKGADSTCRRLSYGSLPMLCRQIMSGVFASVLRVATSLQYAFLMWFGFRQDAYAIGGVTLGALFA